MSFTRTDKQKAIFTSLRSRLLAATATGAVSYAIATYKEDLTTNGALSNIWTGDTSSFVKSGGALRRSANYGPSQTIVLGDVVADQVIRIGYDTTDPAWDSQKQYYLLLRTNDGSSYARVRIDTDGNRNVFGLTITMVVDGTVGSGTTFYRNYGLSRRQGDLEIKIVDGEISVAFDGYWSYAFNGNYSYPYDRFKFSRYGLPAAQTSGKFAITSETWSYPLATHISVDALKFSLESISDFVGNATHDSLTGYAIAKGILKEASYGYRARLTNRDTGVLERDWFVIPDNQVTVTSGTYTARIPLTCNKNYQVEFGYLDSTNKLRSATRAVMAGEIIGTVGQSNSRGMAGGSADEAERAGTNYAAYVYPTFSAGIPNGTFATLTNGYRPSIILHSAKILSEKLNKPVASFAGGQDGFALSGLLKDSAGWNGTNPEKPGVKMFADVISGTVTAYVYDQGEAEADATDFPNIDISDRADKLVQMRNELAVLHNNPNLVMVITLVGNFTYTDGPSGAPWPGVDRKRNQDREAKLLATKRSPYIFISSSHVGCQHGGDAYHYTPAGQTEMARRNGYSIAKARGVATPDGRGPLIVQVVKDSARVLRVKLDMNGATTLSDAVTLATTTNSYPTIYPNQFNGFHVSGDDFASLLQISGIVRDGFDLVITMAVDLPANVKLRYFFGGSYIDNVTYLGGGYNDNRLPIPIFPTIVNMTVGAAALTSADYGWA